MGITAFQCPNLSLMARQIIKPALCGLCYLWGGWVRIHAGSVGNSPGDCFRTRTARGRSPEKFAQDEFRAIPPFPPNNQARNCGLGFLWSD